ncbi:TPA: uL15 family ribosomal protein [archaeon]|uniref:Large ribosomal subunit protein uL15 n=1 Tax=Candidatus Naiadarchaeum limnaeum TaxID=2756139 RepID=A0A832XLY6_9ARCH|nr:uL15 family ribosomal protein [Candidatus Naiadarchaeum limnaeum]
MSKSKPRKIRNLRGRKTGFGAKKKHRGAGSRGGRGKAGWHKYKWSYVTTYAPGHFKKPSMKPKPDTVHAINLWQINEMAAKQNLKEINLENYKVLSSGKISHPLVVKAAAFSEKAKEKIQGAGGKAEIIKKQKGVVEKKA